MSSAASETSGLAAAILRATAPFSAATRWIVLCKSRFSHLQGTPGRTSGDDMILLVGEEAGDRGLEFCSTIIEGGEIFGGPSGAYSANLDEEFTHSPR